MYVHDADEDGVYTTRTESFNFLWPENRDDVDFAQNGGGISIRHLPLTYYINEVKHVLVVLRDDGRVLKKL